MIEAERLDRLDRLEAETPVLGSASRYLLDQFAKGTPAEKLTVIHAAHRLGFRTVLLGGLDASDGFIQAAAAAALASLDPGPDAQTLARMALSDVWIVRWQAVTIIALKLDTGALDPPSGELLWDALGRALAKGEDQPPIVGAIIGLLTTMNAERSSELALALLDDRRAAILEPALRILRLVGGRSALSKLRQLGRAEDIPEAVRCSVDETLVELQNRCPCPSIKETHILDSDESQILVDGTAIIDSRAVGIHCVTTLDNAEIGGLLSAEWRYEDELLTVQTRSCADICALQPTAEGGRRVLFSIRRGPLPLKPGRYRVRISIDDQPAAELAFQIVSHVAMRHRVERLKRRVSRRWDRQSSQAAIVVLGVWLLGLGAEYLSRHIYGSDGRLAVAAWLLDSGLVPRQTALWVAFSAAYGLVSCKPRTPPPSMWRKTIQFGMTVCICLYMVAFSSALLLSLPSLMQNLLWGLLENLILPSNILAILAAVFSVGIAGAVVSEKSGPALVFFGPLSLVAVSLVILAMSTFVSCGAAILCNSLGMAIGFVLNVENLEATLRSWGFNATFWVCGPSLLAAAIKHAVR